MTSVGSLCLSAPWRLCIGVEMSRNEKKAAVCLIWGLFVAASVFWTGLAAYSDEPAGIPASVSQFVPAPQKTFNIWPDLPPGGVPADLKEESWRDVDDSYHSVFVNNVAIPTLAYYPAENPNGACVLIFPGGGYATLAYNYEGADIAEWFAQAGVSAFVLKYRVPSREGVPRYWAAFQDAQRAIRLVRSNAEEYRIDPNKIGVLGFSAGGHLAFVMANESNAKTYEPIDDVDKVDPKPNFSVPIYPGYLLEDINDFSELKLSDAIKIDPNAPPHFIAVASDDANRGFASAILYCELKRKGVPVELHIPLEGGHGFGIRKDKGVAAEWIQNCEKWLHTIKMIQ